MHRLYSSGTGHPDPYPYSGGSEDLFNSAIPHGLRRALAYQRELFANLPGPPPSFVAIDFTLPEDGYAPPEFGLEALWRALEAAGPTAFEALHRARADAENDQRRAKARPLIYGYGAVSAGAGAVPLPLVGVGGVAGTLAVMLRTVAGQYGFVWTPGAFAQFSGAVGGGALAWWVVRYGFREMLKLIPVIGTGLAGVLNAGAAFAMTVGVGEAACVWLGYWRRGLTAPTDEVRRAFAEGLAAGLRQAKGQIGKASRAPG